MEVWVKRELDGAVFPDQRLKARLGKLLGDFGQRIGGTVPMACQDWAATKAAYRFFANSRVDERTILAGHFAATKTRFAPTSGPILVLHDTTEFIFQRDAPDGIGQLSLIKGRHDRLINLLAVLCVVGWRVFWLTMVNRATPDAPATSVLTQPEIEVLDHMVGRPPRSNRTVAHYLLQIAKLGGYLARAQDPPPGNLVLWRGLSRITDIVLGFSLEYRGCG